MTTHHPVRGMRKQRGLVAVIVTIALFSFMGIAALAVDINHALMNRTKLQNSVDAAALSAALALDHSDLSTVTSAEALSIATTAAKDALAQMAKANGNTELDFVTEPVEVSITLSNRGDFTGIYSVALEEHYVRVAVSHLPLASFVMQIFGLDKQLAASAVAGPSTGGGSCNLVPMAVCAIDKSAENSGYGVNNVYALKLASNTSEMGPGNFQLLDFNALNPEELTDPEKLKLSELLGGSFEGCTLTGNKVVSKPGNNIGPVGEGLNSRFDNDNSKLPADLYPADLNPEEALLDPDYADMHGLKKGTTLNELYDMVIEAEIAVKTGVDPKNKNKTLSDAEKASYQAIINEFSPINAKEALTLNYDEYKATGSYRRRLSVPIIDCSGGETGKSEYEVTAIGCFFLLQRAPESNGDKQEIYGEYLQKCPTTNVPYNGVSNNLGTYRIVLYDDPFNKES
ncbi:MAG: pilus assembly protein TadG-related protein [Vibrio sp.]|uniref:pilus assembly protein TadG-related protein n=1 Tax=Vibrio sp. TaxID=678 RepID=UPI003A87B89A